jgi:hypothetical protein
MPWGGQGVYLNEILPDQPSMGVRSVPLVPGDGTFPQSVCPSTLRLASGGLPISLRRAGESAQVTSRGRPV